jgi:hypothetical protein
LNREWPQYWFYCNEKLEHKIREAASPASALKVFHLTTFPFLGEIFKLREALKNSPDVLNPSLLQKLTNTYWDIMSAHVQRLYDPDLSVNLQDSSGVEIVVAMVHHNVALSNFIHEHGSDFPDMRSRCLQQCVPYYHR